MKIRGNVGASISALGGRILAGRKARDDTNRNRRRLGDAAVASRELRAQRIADSEIRKTAAALACEADQYIAAAMESEGAFYEPLSLDALNSAAAAISSWKKAENEAAALRQLSVDGTIRLPRRAFSADIVVPGSDSRNDPGPEARNGEARERTLGILREAINLFHIQNSIRVAGDPDAALASLGESCARTAMSDINGGIGEAEV